MSSSLPSQEVRRLVAAARTARERAYAPYSGIRVGAAVLTEDGHLYGGANIENASYGLSNCAERTAIFKAVSEGHPDIRAIAIVTVDRDLSYPCGACRQVMLQFGPHMEVVLSSLRSHPRRMRLSALLPHPFPPEHLRRDAPS